MSIAYDAQRVLLSIYKLIDEDSYTLYIKFKMSDMANSIGMSTKRLNLCIHYLIDAGYLKGDFAYNSNEESAKEVMITASGVKYAESVL